MVHPVQLGRLRRQADACLAARSIAATLALNEGMSMLVPISGGLGHGLAHFLPDLEPSALDRERAQHLPPRLNQVQIGGVCGLEDKLQNKEEVVAVDPDALPQKTDRAGLSHG